MTSNTNPAPPGILRPLDVSRDLGQLASLLHDIFFKERGEEEKGEEALMLRGLRNLANNRRAQRWIQTSDEIPGMPYYGYVWEVNGTLVGNLTLIPIRHRGKKVYLIANVGVKPAYRGRGIASALMERAEVHARQHKASALWLQVRSQNAAAVGLYRKLGFRIFSTTNLWRSPKDASEHPIAVPDPQTVVRRGLTSRQFWPREHDWLQEAYPARLAWHHLLPTWDLLAPGFKGFWKRLVTGRWALHWYALRDGEFVGGVAFLPARKRDLPGEIALALPPDPNAHQVAALMRPILRRGRAIRFEYPAGRAEGALQEVGLALAEKLYWMAKEIR